MIVQHNLTAMNSNRMLGLTTKSQAKSTERLSSGYKINRAADDAAGLAISEKMRRQVRGLAQASANAQDGISAVQTAEGALTEVHDMLQRMNELAVKAANSTMSESDRKSVQDEVDQLITEIDRVSETTKFNETYLLKGDTNGEKGKTYSYKEAETLSKDLYYLSGTEVKTVAKGTYFSAVTTDLTYFTDKTGKPVGDVCTTTDFVSTTAVVNTDNYFKKTGDDYVKVNQGDVFSGTTTDYYTISFTTDGTISAATQVTQNPVTATGYVLSTDVYLKDGTKLTNGTSLGTTVTVADYFKSKGAGKFDPSDAATLADYKTSAAVQLTDANGNEISANGLYAYFSDQGTYKGEGLFLKSGDSLKAATQADIDALVKVDDKETGALAMTLHVGSDATKNNQIELKIEAMSAKGIGINDVKVTGKNDENALNAIETISAALKQVSEQRSAMGAIQNRLEHTINNLENIVENTTAAESQIRDTDMATEMVKYANNNILAQAGQAMLAQANQVNQGVLSLLG